MDGPLSPVEQLAAHRYGMTLPEPERSRYMRWVMGLAAGALAALALAQAALAPETGHAQPEQIVTSTGTGGMP